MNQKQYKKILIIKQGSLGDIVFALPAMYSIRFFFEHSKITLLTESKFINFLKKSEYFNNFIVDDRKGLWSTTIIIIKLLFNKYDLIIFSSDFALLKKLKLNMHNFH